MIALRLVERMHIRRSSEHLDFRVVEVLDAVGALCPTAIDHLLRGALIGRAEVDAMTAWLRDREPGCGDVGAPQLEIRDDLPELIGNSHVECDADAFRESFGQVVLDAARLGGAGVVRRGAMPRHDRQRARTNDSLEHGRRR